jgi:hypothetical protein
MFINNPKSLVLLTLTPCLLGEFQPTILPMWTIILFGKVNDFLKQLTLFFETLLIVDVCNIRTGSIGISIADYLTSDKIAEYLYQE